MVNLDGPQVSYWLVCTRPTLAYLSLSGLRIVTSDSNSPRSAIESARRTIAIERKAVEQLEQRIDDSFSRAVDLLASVEGRVIVSGMGKSGHIGNKIAATLASTGTPAQFVHPAEACHGDMGMITRSDAALLMSNSGTTSEITALLRC